MLIPWRVCPHFYFLLGIWSCTHTIYVWNIGPLLLVVYMVWGLKDSTPWHNISSICISIKLTTTYHNHISVFDSYIVVLEIIQLNDFFYVPTISRLEPYCHFIHKRSKTAIIDLPSPSDTPNVQQNCIGLIQNWMYIDIGDKWCPLVLYIKTTFWMFPQINL